MELTLAPMLVDEVVIVCVLLLLVLVDLGCEVKCFARFGSTIEVAFSEVAFFTEDSTAEKK